MVSEIYPRMSLDDVADFRNGKSISPERYSEDGRYPVFGANGQIARSNYILNTEGVVAIGRVGAYCGSVHYIPGPSWVTDNAIVATAKAGNNIRFLYYLFDHLELRRTAIGSAQPLMTQGGLKVVHTVIPPVKVQEAIACILGALDDKIELNRQMNRTLEEMAQTIFKSWFVNFDPIRAKIAGQQPPRLKPEIAALFPDAFEDSVLGKIPKGWRIKTIGDVCDLAYGKALKADQRQPGIVPVMGSNGQVGLHNEALVKGPGIVVGRKGNPGTITWVNSDFFPIDTAFYVVPHGGDDHPLTYLFYALEKLSLANLSADSAVPGLNRNIAYRSEMVIPDRSILELFDKHLMTIRNRQSTIEEESSTLSTIRNTLLPKLISGELRVPDAERIAGRCT
ncbi:MAG: Type I restriction modification DNA specificity domain protein [Syntrophus sp. PtaB.Bin001]|nr:MAG: Type I restriction modification DNA specificity domain protein [Syntrophus sp. PtaB.Bin001]